MRLCMLTAEPTSASGNNSRPRKSAASWSSEVVIGSGKAQGGSGLRSATWASGSQAGVGSSRAGAGCPRAALAWCGLPSREAAGASSEARKGRFLRCWITGELSRPPKPGLPAALLCLGPSAHMFQLFKTCYKHLTACSPVTLCSEDGLFSSMEL